MKRSDSLYIGLIFVVFTVSVVVWAAISPFVVSEEAASPSMEAASQYRYTATGEQYTVSPEQFTRLCLGMDCVPSLSEEQVSYTSVDAADAWMNSSDMVISMTWNGETVAYPVTVMQHHLIANTRISGDPITVTYAPHAGYATAFSRRIRTPAGDQELSFRFTGRLLHGDIIMQDTATGTRWSPYHGEGIVGDMAGTALPRIDTEVARWSLWKQQHPNGSVLSRAAGIYNTSRYTDDPYFTYRSSTTVPGTVPELDGLHPKDIVYGVRLNGEAAAYRSVHVKDLELVEHTVGNRPVMLVQDERTGAVRGFSRQVDGRTLSFAWNGTETLQSQDGTTWTPHGHAIGGPMAGSHLTQVPLTRMYWFAWKRFNPSTQLYAPAG